MCRTSVLTLLVLVMALVMVSCGQSAAASQAPRILFVGDSLTVGYFATAPAKTFRELVTTHEHATQETLGAHYGIRADEVLAGLKSNQHSIPKADVIILELGTNDFTGASLDHPNAGAEPQRTFNSDYATLAAELRAASPSARLLCLSIWMPEGTWDGQAYAKSYNQAIQGACEAQHGTYVDISRFAHADRGPAGTSTFQGPSDNFHPNDAGHAAIANAIEAVLDK